MAESPKRKRPSRRKGKQQKPKPELPSSIKMLERYTGDLPDKPIMGRPTKYTPEAGFLLISIMKDGYTATAAAGVIGVHRDTIYEWAQKHPDFSDALKRGHALRQFRLETQLLAALDGPSVRAAETALNRTCPEWRGDDETPEQGEHPLAELARQLAGTVLRPRELPPPEPIEVEYEDTTGRETEPPRPY